MLVCYHNQSRLAKNDLVHLAFLFSLHETIAEIEILADIDDGEDLPSGFLVEVPFLQQVPLEVQVELLAETWSRYRCSKQIEATLLDAAVVYAAFMTAARIVNDEPELALAWLADEGRKLNHQFLRRARERFEEMFDSWWDDRDFLMLEDFQDMPPEQAQLIKTMLRLPNEMIQPMFDVLERGRVSTDVGEKLEGLLAPEKIQDVVLILMHSP